jgi:hypothetical protein
MRRWLRVTLFPAMALAMAGCDAIYGLDSSTLSADASNTSLEGPDGTIASGADASADAGMTDAGATGMDSTIGPPGTPDGSDEDAAAGDDGPGVVQGEAGCAATCSGGTCTAEGRCLIILATTGGPTALALKVPNVYFTDNVADAVLSVPMDGGAVQTLAPSQDSPLAITVDGTNVYWANSATIMKMSLDDGGIATLASGQDPEEIAVDSVRIYWTDLFAGTVQSAPLAGGGPVKPLVGGEAAPAFIATDGRNVYFTNFSQGTSDCTVVSVPVDGGTPVNIAQNQVAPAGIAIDATRAYWANNGSATPGGVMSALLDGGDPITIATAPSTANKPYGIAIDDTSVYWTNDVGLSAGTVMKAPLDGGPATTLASQEEGPTAIAVDSTSVYWITNTDVRKLTPK